MRVYNFSAGPSTLPLEILQQAREELLDWRNTGTSVMEISHRSKDFLALAQESESDLRHLLAIPSHYSVLFLQGGARSQFAMVPMNFLGNKKIANYMDTGIWSTLALEEARRYCKVNVVASSSDRGGKTIPPRDEWKINPDAAYFHYVANETINGIEFPHIPEVGALPLISDMSSNILSQPLDVSRFALIYAGAQKNIAPAGLTIVIFDKTLLGDALPFTPNMFRYEAHVKENSMYNTPPTFAWYMAGLMFKWLKSQGGLERIAQKNSRKAVKLYSFIDNNNFYENAIDPDCRSKMNVVFNLKDETLNALFLEQASVNGLANLRGHKRVGGMRASIYNSMPEEGVDLLIQFMDDFSKRFG
jgi:phosphoserine aminotransferase